MASATTKTAPAQPEVADSARYKAVRRVKNVSKTHIESRRNVYVRAVAASKDPQKVLINQARVDALNYALKVIAEA
jgi:hypothetical protein